MVSLLSKPSEEISPQLVSSLPLNPQGKAEEEDEDSLFQFSVPHPLGLLLPLAKGVWGGGEEQPLFLTCRSRLPGQPGHSPLRFGSLASWTIPARGDPTEGGWQIAGSR